ncbi:hypothetical protein [Cyclobacterium marinum]|uniref:Integral membrane protein n=1 Tax=Cyclobacterium marinum (strain ATCC 25205 / DSM 745 / LMG 13164 / NCIMB 1802) TaxID=880070 RepID=G0IUQ7_CYCMS|nr:hypothetical protein [Cyclobacterium marinum]AEL25449.1 hypothetical protein Cycma_1695 [Cyclobacterium marinum DSM 745]
MKEKINFTLHSISLILILALLAWYFVGTGITAATAFTYMIMVLIVVEITSLALISSTYPESHTSFKIGIIAALFILFGIKTMMPSFFIPISVTLITINFLYNFYSNSKRRKGAFKRKKKKTARF